ncbi:disulfide bond formation protein B [Paenalkalicoccus suaedae]|uniref:Probable disulfide formation protein n=1 Tax=Paenalkalicoccus suaedae TaxID=2592382 RepID=A0A859FJ50_9BACI|nr:disulfide oxidoreductase [Paenalkalicoccus suaedae]QKS72496.1 disulfide bond formation protein B [Paenalkalicoccus suaedae]
MGDNQKRIELLLTASWGVAFIATLGSLFFSEIRGFIPCELCWAQRIFMYPMAITLAIATVKKDATQAYYALPLAVIGAGISTYHYLLQKVPALQETSNICGIVPCNAQYINYAGFITIPFLALTAFILIIILLVYVIKLSKEPN